MLRHYAGYGLEHRRPRHCREKGPKTRITHISNGFWVVFRSKWVPGGLRQQKHSFWQPSIFLGNHYDSKQNVHGTHATSTGRGRGGSTIIIYKENIKFNNNNNNFTHGPPRFLPTRGSSRRRVLPPHSWGEFIIKRVSCSPHTQLSRPMS